MKKFDLAVVTGSYQKNGEDKKKYKNIGLMIEDGDKRYILLDRTLNPAGVPSDRETIMVGIYEPKAKSSHVPDGDMEDPF